MLFDFFVSDPPRSVELAAFVEAENQIVDRFLEGGYDLLWMVELDVEVPPDAFRLLESLDVDIACGYVRRHSGDGLILGFLDENMRVWYLPENAVRGNILSGWVMAGTSCVLFRRRVFEGGLRFRYLRGVTPDIVFMFDAQCAGFEAKVHGDVLCGHLPEFPLATYTPDVLDVGCGHKARGNVNVDLNVEPTAHRCADQRKNTDVRLNVGSGKSPKRPWVPNFVRADACFLPFRARSVRKAFSSHVIEHLPDPLAFLRELCRVATGEIEVHCPNGEFKSCQDELKPLHLWDFSAGWFREQLQAFPGWDFLVRWDYSQSEPWELVVEGYRVSEVLQNE
jgi:SAM-dependent methyltransferase